MAVLERDDGQPVKKKEDLRDEIRKLETPHITDVKSLLLDSLASGRLGKGLSNREHLTMLRGYCEDALAQLFVHSFTCEQTCKNIPEGMRLTEETLTMMQASLEGIVVPPMQYHDERDRAAGLIRSYFEVPEVGQQYQSSSQPERQPFLSERTQEDYAHRILNDDMLRKVAGLTVMLQVHGILKFEEDIFAESLSPPSQPQSPVIQSKSPIPRPLARQLPAVPPGLAAKTEMPKGQEEACEVCGDSPAMPCPRCGTPLCRDDAHSDECPRKGATK